jgi:hypothetical protein
MFQFYLLSGILGGPNQQLVEDISKYVKIKYDIIDCFDQDPGFTAKVTFTNTGSRDITGKDFEIYFNNIRMIEFDKIRPHGTDFGDSGLVVHHVNGVLFKLVPKDDFDGFKTSSAVEAEFVSEAWMVGHLRNCWRHHHMLSRCRTLM